MIKIKIKIYQSNRMVVPSLCTKVSELFSYNPNLKVFIPSVSISPNYFFMHFRGDFSRKNRPSVFARL